MDALIVVANDKLLQILPESVPVNEALTCADDILRQVREDFDERVALCREVFASTVESKNWPKPVYDNM